MICFQISIFEPLKTTKLYRYGTDKKLWFAFELVSLNHWKQRHIQITIKIQVVICFRISIFEPLKTTKSPQRLEPMQLWFAFELVSLNHWKQHFEKIMLSIRVVICFRISIFEPLKTTLIVDMFSQVALWFAFELVSLNHWKQHEFCKAIETSSCDLLSN